MTDWRIPRVAVAGMTCEERAWHVIDAIWSDSRDIESTSLLGELTEGQRAVYALTWVQREVSNGGFDQCLSNPAGGLVPDAIAGARRLGLNPLAELITDAANLALGTTDRLARAERQRRLEALAPSEIEALDSLADDFYDLLDETPLDDAVCAFVDSEPDQFLLVGEPTDEEIAQALLDLGRQLVARPPRDFERIESLLSEARDRAARAANSSLVAQVESLSSQLPDLRG